MTFQFICLPLFHFKVMSTANMCLCLHTIMLKACIFLQDVYPMIIKVFIIMYVPAY